MGKNELTVSAEELRTWLEENKEVIVLDVRPKEQREEWQIPGSKSIDAYERLKNNDPGAPDEIDFPKNFKVVTVCAMGKTSQITANKLRKKGIEAYSLDGGMKAWSTAWNTAKLTFPDFEIIQVRRTGKGCLSYVISSYNEAIVVDASLPIEIYERIIKQNNLNLNYVIETHIHADHLSRSKQLAEGNQASLYLPVPNNVQFAFNPIMDGAILRAGNLIIEAIATPGHTLESTSFLINQSFLLTGDTLFTNGVGRPDLKSDAEESMLKTKMLYKSLQKIINLPGDIIVLPSHTSKPPDFDHKMIQATISEILNNVSMLRLDEEEFTETVLSRIPPEPANYHSIVGKNLKGDFSDIDPLDLEAGANQCAII